MVIMNKQLFKEKLKDIGLTQKKFAQLVGYSYSAVKGWKEIPKWVDVILTYMELVNKMSFIGESLYQLEDIKDKIKELTTNINAKRLDNK